MTEIENLGRDQNDDDGEQKPPILPPLNSDMRELLLDLDLTHRALIDMDRQSTALVFDGPRTRVQPLIVGFGRFAEQHIEEAHDARTAAFKAFL